MKYFIITLATTLLMINLLFCPASGAQDMRLISRQVEAENEAAKNAKEQSRKRLFRNRKSLVEIISNLEINIETINEEIAKTTGAKYLSSYPLRSEKIISLPE